MAIKLFKPEDFNFPETMSAAYLPDRAASLANEILQREIEKWPVVVQMEPQTNYGWYEEREHYREQYKRIGRVAFIEEIKKEPCKHEPKRNFQNGAEMLPEPKCYHCGVKLVAEWKEA